IIKDADTPGSQHDFGKNLIPAIIDKYNIYAYPFRDPETGQQAYWRDVGTIDAYWEANMELISVTPQLNLYDEKWPIMTRQMQAPPAKFVFDDPGRRGMAISSMVSAGCLISGAHVDRSVIFNNCYLRSYSTVEESVVLPSVDIGRNCTIKRAIIDRAAKIPDGMEIGVDHDADRERGFRVTESGLTLVTPDMLGQRLHFTR
ncbi:MAG: glucose-1-phosphate adenylyltransferase, partial [Gammaproteobacteria bacterium]|nr:glucose-1-phosphate adenylyltransferase [Gammaproteobacteria bacterium]